MSFDAVLRLIKSLIGLTPESIGIETIERMVQRRMKSVGIENVSDYYILVQKSAEEKQNLINEISVPETWFFRDHEPFKVLSDYVKKIKYVDGKSKIRILSVPCSSGEEPYSISMVLCDAGFSKNEYEIDAVDVSTSVLEKARKGIYSENSFRGKDISYRGNYFEKQDSAYVITPSIRTTVNFHKANILNDNLMFGKGPYDVVFCRNLLIYFDYETKCRVLEKLHSIMDEKALLVLGHAETGRIPQGMFESMHLPGSFSYQKIGATSVTTNKRENSSSVVFPTQALPKKGKRVSADNRVDVSSGRGVKRELSGETPKKPVISRTTEEWVESIQVLADEGNLKEALTECDKLIEAVPDSARGYYLKGVVLLALDADVEAIDTFKKAVYLDPNHYESLIHLSILAEEQGDLRASENFRARADRLRNSGQVADN